MTYDAVLLQRLRDRGNLKEADLREGGSGHLLPYPLSGAVIAVSLGEAQGEYLLGQDDPLLREQLLVRVAVPQESGSRECRRIAQKTAEEILEADEEKRILSFSLGLCQADEESGIRRLDMTFGLRPQRCREVGD